MEATLTRLRKEQKIIEINSALGECESPGLFDGNAGLALYYGYSGQSLGQADHIDLCQKYARASLRGVVDKPENFSFSSGYTGICWMIAHLARKGMLESDDYLSEFDEPIIALSELNLKVGNYDFMHGGLGAALYFLERLPDIRAVASLEKIVALIESISLRGGDGIKWGSAFPVFENQRTGLKSYNLGLSHGIPSIIRILVYIYQVGICLSKCRELIEGSIHWMLNQKLEKNSPSRYPTAIIQGLEPLASRTAWCYGDAGIASTLFFAGRALDRHDWESEGVCLMLEVAGRRDPAVTRVKDSGICHGAAGMAHFFHVFNEYAYCKQFKAAETFWEDQILIFGSREEGLAGYKKWQPESLGGPKNVSGLLEGIAGIALVLDEYTTDMNTCWDRCLLIQ